MFPSCVFCFVFGNLGSSCSVILEVSGCSSFWGERTMRKRVANLHILLFRCYCFLFLLSGARENRKRFIYSNFFNVVILFYLYFYYFVASIGGVVVTVVVVGVLIFLPHISIIIIVDLFIHLFIYLFIQLFTSSLSACNFAASFPHEVFFFFRQLEAFMSLQY